jgi:hypothetical protein
LFVERGLVAGSQRLLIRADDCSQLSDREILTVFRLAAEDDEQAQPQGMT